MRIKTCSLVIGCLLVAGCGGQRHAAPVNAELARNSLRVALNSWKKGDDLQRLRSASPSITVQDMDWLAGSQLLDYAIHGDGLNRDANLHCSVTLTLREAKGQELTKEVIYIVGTDPAITVFREMRF